MSRRRRLITTVVIILIGVGIYAWLMPQRSGTDRSKVPRATAQSSSTVSGVSGATPPRVNPRLSKPGVPQQNNENTNSLAALQTVFQKPLKFYGMVVDEKGAPVSAATVVYSANNDPNWNAEGTKGTTTTDARGLFSIEASGIGIFVRVSKNGYYEVPTSQNHQIGSYAGFSNAEKIGRSDHPIPSSNKRAVFSLIKKGQPVPLIRVTERPIRIPKNGVPVKIDLKTGTVAAQGALQVECWTQDQARDARGHYPWRCRVSVPGGGLIRRAGDFAFEAPSEGYQPFDDIGPRQEKWSPDAEQQYFVKTADNHFARLTVSMVAGGDHFVAIDCYFNPQAGSRNLE
jgi:hypothetical protein